jgi:cob(I)alamin adenosyltransferase
MSEDEQIEAERIERLEENRKGWAEQSVDLDERFGPGSFGCHEAIHMADVFARLIDRELCGHSAVLRNPDWFKLACRARDSLAQLYQDVGRAQL